MVDNHNYLSTAQQSESEPPVCKMWSAAVGAVSNAYKYLSSRLASRTAKSNLLPLHTRKMTTSSSAQTNALGPYDHSAEARFIVAPNPEWSFGQPITTTPEGRAWMEGTKEGWKVIDAETEDPTCAIFLV